MSATEPFLGIDFGTSHCRMAWLNPKTGQAEVLKNAEGEEQTPSVVYLGDGEVLVGTDAVNMLDDEGERGRVLVSVKRDIAGRAPFPAGSRLVGPVEVAAELFGKLKRDAEAGHFREPVRRAVVTCPAAFGELERSAIAEAARAAGFAEVELLEEPVAAALAYARAGLKVGRTVLVYDLGAGTFDLAVLTTEDADGGYRLALPPKGVARCGGDDFDRALYDHCDALAADTLGRPIADGRGLDLRFLRDCKLRKENLSARERCEFSSFLTGGVRFKHALERVTFERLIADPVGRTVGLTKELVGEAEAAGYAVETVVLIGGSSRVPLIARQLAAALPVAPQPWHLQDLAVALGAAYHGRQVPPPPPPPPPPVPLGLLQTLPLGGEVNRVAFAADGSHLYVSGGAAAVRCVRTTDGREAGCFPAAFSTALDRAGTVTTSVWTRDDKTLITGHPDWSVRLRDGATGAEVGVLTGHRGVVTALAVTADGRLLVSGSAYRQLQPCGRPLRGTDYSVRLWDLAGRRAVRQFVGHTRPVAAVAISPDGRRVLSAGYDRTTRVWDAESGREVVRLDNRSVSVSAAAFLPGGRVVVCGDADGAVWLWDAETGKELHALGRHDAEVRAVCVAPDGQSAVTCDGGPDVKVWGLGTFPARG